MRIHKFLPLAMAALLTASCASDNTDDNGKQNGSGDPSYLAINLVSVGSAGTRANTNEDFMDNGTPAESKISDIRFYFFNADGSPYTLAGNGVNWTEPSDDFNGSAEAPGSNVSNKSEAVLVIRSESGDAAPYSIVAVANAHSLGNSSDKALGNSSKTLEELTDNIQDRQFFLTDAASGATNYKKAAQAKNFVMSNSVYEQAGQTVCESFVSGHVASSPEAAKANPVDIYVERVVAKVTATIDESGAWQKGDGTNWATDEYGMAVGKTTSGSNVYAVVKGWNVADENGLAQLVKQIDTKWTNSSLGFPTGETWSSADYHRSFWSSSVKVGENNQAINYSYTQISGNKLGSCVYTLPNTLQVAGDFTDKYNNRLTKFIVTAQLRYQDDNGQWQDAEICEYKGIQYIGCDVVLDAIGHDSNIYVKTSGTEGDTYTSIGHLDLTLQADNNTNTKNYKAIATVQMPLGPVTGTISRDDLYTKNADGTFTQITLQQANAILAKETADVRANGMTYYYTPIRHLGTDPLKPAYYGIVRNHHYRIALTSLSGFGTPVVDSEKTIIPTIPDNEATYLAARINVLSWRVVKQNADLDSGNK